MVPSHCCFHCYFAIIFTVFWQLLHPIENRSVNWTHLESSCNLFSFLSGHFGSLYHLLAFHHHWCFLQCFYHSRKDGTWDETDLGGYISLKWENTSDLFQYFVMSYHVMENMYFGRILNNSPPTPTGSEPAHLEFSRFSHSAMLPLHYEVDQFQDGEPGRIRLTKTLSHYVCISDYLFFGETVSSIFCGMPVTLLVIMALVSHLALQESLYGPLRTSGAKHVFNKNSQNKNNQLYCIWLHI